MRKAANKKTECKKIRSKRITTIVGALIILLIMLSAFAFPLRFLVRFEQRLMPLIENATLSAQQGDNDAVYGFAEQICNVLYESERQLKMFVNHEDIYDAISMAENLVRLKADGDVVAYMQCICGILSNIEYIIDCNKSYLINIM